MATYEDIEIDQGSDVNVQLYLVNEDGTKKDLLGHSVAAKIKKTYNTSDSESIVFNTQIAQPSADGIVNLQLTNSQTNAMKAGRYVYDVELSFLDSASNTITERVLEGKLIVTPSVT